MAKIQVTGKQVRAFFAANPTLIPTEGAHTLVTGARGRIAPSVRDAFNAANKGKAEYTEGTPKSVSLSFKHTQPSGRVVTKTARVPERQVRALAGSLAGLRGPLSNAAKSAAGVAYAKSLKG